MSDILRIRVTPVPALCHEGRAIELFVQTKKRIVPPVEKSGAEAVYEVELTRNRKGELGGENIHRYADKRDFIYLQWRYRDAPEVGYRRIKLYASQFEGRSEITISGVLKDGTPACSTAQLL